MENVGICWEMLEFGKCDPLSQNEHKVATVTL